MNKWKDELKIAFDAPQPMKKRNFLRHLDLPPMHVQDFLLSQIGYIRKWVWCVSILSFVVSILGLAFLPGTVLWLISGLTPLLALTIISETGRSEFYEMAELEMATRFSLRGVTFARLVILGTINLLLLGMFLLICSWNDALTLPAAALYIITPFLLSAFTGLCIVRRYRGKDAMYACVGTSVGISIFLFLSHNIISFIYQEQYLTAWMTTALALLYGNGKQYISIIKQKEEIAWNLS